MELTLKHRETHECVLSTVATDALVLKHQAICIHSADEISIVLGQFHTKVFFFFFFSYKGTAFIVNIIKE